MLPFLDHCEIGYLHPIIIRSWNWRFSWYIPGTAALLMVFVNALMLRSTPEELERFPWGQKKESVQRKILDKKYDSLKMRYSVIVHSSDFWIIGLSYLLASLSLYIITTYMVDYARNSLRFPYERASLLATVHGFSQIAGVLTLPLLSDHIGRRNTLFLTNLLIAASSTGIILSGSNQVFLFISVGVLGACYGVTFPMYGACAGDYFSKEVIGSIVGAWTPFYGIGAIVAHRLGGQIKDHTGSFQLTFTIAIVTALVASILLLFIRTSKRVLG
jgi:sugar phosphate permease